MSVIIRLQNLPWAANAIDIRQFFRGLGIPEGGVHIVGGELGDAFIAFSTDEDARQAFMLNGGKIKEVQIKLMLSSRTEMQKVIEAARNPLAAFIQRATPVLPAAVPAALPSMVPEITKKNDFKEKEKRDRRRSHSRDRRDRSHSRDRRDKRRRDRSRSRSRDRRDRRRRDRSHSKDRRFKGIDHYNRERRSSEENATISNATLPAPSITTVQPDIRKPAVWANNVPVVQTPTLMNTFLSNHLQQNALLMSLRNGIQNQTESIHRSLHSWNVNSLANRVDGISQKNSDDSNAISNMAGIKDSGSDNDSQSSFNRSAPQRGTRRASRFDVPYERASLQPPTLNRPHPLDRLDGSEFSERGDYDRLYRLERPVNKDCCIQLKSYYGGYGEIRKFFNGLFIPNNGIKFVNNEYGTRTGLVYIRFASQSGKERALSRNGLMLRDFSVELSTIDDELFDNTVDRYQPLSNNKEEIDEATDDIPTDCSCLALDDLPLFTKEHDMLKIFTDYPVQQILLENRQRHVIAYIKFSTAGDAKQAAREKAQCCFDNKPLKFRMCSDEEYQIASRGQNEIVELLDDDDDPEIAPTIETDCVSLSGLPKKTTDRDVSDFFSDVAIVPNKIHLISSNFGFIGQAYCEFPTIQDAEKAVQKDGLPLGSGIVKVTPILRSEMETSIGSAIPREPVIKPLLSIPPIRPLTPRDFEPTPDRRKYEATADHGDFEPPPDHRNYDSIPDHGDYDIVNEPRNYEGVPNDRRYEEPSDNGNYESAPDHRNYEPEPDHRNYKLPLAHRNYDDMPERRNYKPIDNRNFDLSPGRRNYDPLPDIRNYDTPRVLPSLLGLGRIALRHPLPMSLPEMAPPGCTLLMENVPYKAGLDDILGFFQGYRVQADNVLRRYNDNGTPSGEAKVIFNSKDEAYQALEECNMQHLRERTIYLSLC